MSLKKMGRPKVAKKQHKKPGFSVRLVGSERREIENAIKSSREEKSQWIRDALLSKARRHK
jgi:hypothetical protein